MFRSFANLLVQSWRWLVFAVVGFVHSLQNNMGIGFLSLALSTVLWVFVTGEQNPPRDGIFAELISVDPVNVPTGLASVGELERVSVKISAPEDLWRNIEVNTFEATIDISELGQGKHDIPVRLHSKDSRVIVREVIPSRVGVELDAIKRAVVPVKLNIIEGPPQGYSVPPVDLPISTVSISGPARLVDLVELASANVNLKGLRTDFRQVVPLVPGTTSGYDVQQVRIDPPTVTLHIPVIREVDFAGLPVIPEVVGSPRSGYWASSMTVSPTTVPVVGPRELLQTITFLKTQPVDISNAATDITQTVSLSLPNEIRLVTPTQIRVDVRILPTDGLRSFQITPSISGLPPGRSATLDVETVEVTLGGLAPELSKVTPTQIPVSVRLDGLGIGTFTVDVGISVPSNLNLVKVSPAKVQATIK